MSDSEDLPPIVIKTKRLHRVVDADSSDEEVSEARGPASYSSSSSAPQMSESRQQQRNVLADTDDEDNDALDHDNHQEQQHEEEQEEKERRESVVEEEVRSLSQAQAMASRYSKEEDDEEEEEVEASRDTRDGCAASKSAPIEDDPVEEDKPSVRSPERSPSPPAREEEEEDRWREDAVSSPERKSSHGSDSYEEEQRASSMSPEPPKAIVKPAVTAAAPANGSGGSNSKPTTPVLSPSSHHERDITKIYTGALVNNSVPSRDASLEKVVRSKPASDITQIYTQSLQREQQSPKLERARGGKPVKDITQLYTAAFNKNEKTTDQLPSPVRPRRNDNITKLYTGGFEKENSSKVNYKFKPNDELTNPKKHNMATVIEREGIREAYTEVMSDNNGVDWAAFVFDEGNNLGVSGKGQDFATFKSFFNPDNRGFGYIKVQTGDEMSKRSKFVFLTWVGNNVSVMKKAKMSTDKLLMKEIIQNLSVEMQVENLHEVSMDHFKAELEKAGGARYGTGVRDM